MTIQLVSDEKIAETSSKGNQEKWYDSSANRWYKLDQVGYEVLVETVVSTLLERSNIEANRNFPQARSQYKQIAEPKDHQTFFGPRLHESPEVRLPFSPAPSRHRLSPKIRGQDAIRAVLQMSDRWHANGSFQVHLGARLSLSDRVGTRASYNCP